ncbi:MAG: 5'-nucleotidase C-terminal domain-containing protein, partial [Prosthecobacter sp.]|nr:5'-nucleotidase C-terminal domain-containing protein [Prosthecobacter sp.]
QPYRLYLPSAYDGKTVLPLLVALHGTGGDQNKYFDHETYGSGIYKTEAEKRGLIVLCPLGTDANGLPTEWRGGAEINVLAAIEDAQKRFRIDPERIVCTGQSMGGTGTTYLCCRYPDIFAAGIPLASTYGHLSLITNLRDVPMFFVQGAKDWPIYAATGPTPITQEMKRLGYKGELWMVPDAPHNTMHLSTPRVLDWALRQKRVAHPRRITHRAYFPPHGRAWWVEIQEIERPSWFAEMDAKAEAENRITVKLKNTSHVVLRPDSTLHDLQKPLIIEIEGREVFHDLCASTQEVLLVRENDTWTATTQPRQITPRTDWKNLVIGTVVEPPTWEGGPETTLGNWLTDAMRDISGADIAICTKGHFRVGSKMRGHAIQAGQTLHLVELINWLRPSDAALATFTLKGSDLLKIIESNLLDGPKDDMFLVQVSGCRYRFDRRRPQGSRIIETDIQPGREYKIVCNSSAITRTDTLHLGEFFGKLKHEMQEPNQLSTVWRFILQNYSRVTAKLEGRVSEVLP